MWFGFRFSWLLLVYGFAVWSCLTWVLLSGLLCFRVWVMDLLFGGGVVQVCLVGSTVHCLLVAYCLGFYFDV